MGKSLKERARELLTKKGWRNIDCSFCSTMGALLLNKSCKDIDCKAYYNQMLKALEEME